VGVWRGGTVAGLYICTVLPQETNFPYCYLGGDSIFCTTRETEALYRDEIHWDLIPRTFLDAMVVARALGIRYIWIDALCIVQNDYSEWQSEAAKMQDIYAGSSFTIAATDSADGSGGCFFDASKTDDSVAEERCTFFSAKLVTGRPSILVKMQSNDIRTSTEKGVLQTRGWVLQEMVLSHRIVHFMRRGVYWQCKTNFKTEEGVSFDAKAMRNTFLPIPHETSTGLNKFWWRWMENYSKRCFTFPKDRIPAMAGLIQHYQALTGDVPILGLWENSFHQDLLWVRENPPDDETVSTNELSNIPSWSWLSCPARLNFDFGDRPSADEDGTLDVKDHTTLVEWDVTWSSEPLVSNVKSARLVITGPVRETVLNIAPENKNYNPPYFNVENEKTDFRQNPRPWRCAGQFDRYVNVEERMSPAKYLCLLLRSRTHIKQPWIRETFLILEPSAVVDGAYQRVGIADIDGSSQMFDLNARRTLNLV
jgi:Heterokaryon incompatibility protein (HET)